MVVVVRNVWYLIWVAGYYVAASRCRWRAAGGGGVDAGHKSALSGWMDGLMEMDMVCVCVCV